MGRGAGIGGVVAAAALGAWAAAAPLSLQVTDAVAEPDYTLQFAFTCPSPWPPQAELRVLFDRNDSGTGHALVLSRGLCRFVRTEGERNVPLGSAGRISPDRGTIRGVVIRRHSRMTAYVDHLRVASAQDDWLQGGHVGWAASEGAFALEDLHVQPAGDTRLMDDFIREPDDPTSWEPVSGAWTTLGPPGTSPTPDRSANPFAFRVQPSPEAAFALATAGEWFWDDYRASVAVKAESAGAVGVTCYTQGANDFMLLRWTSTGEGGPGGSVGRRQLIRVLNGQWTVLAESSGGLGLGSWHELALQVCDGWWTGEIDGQVVAEARDSAFGQGRVGLFAQGVRGAVFDDATVEPVRAVRDDFGGGQIGWWQTASGEWSCRQEHLYGLSPKAGSVEAVLGEADWGFYEIEAEVKPKGARALGLTACRTPDGRAYRVRWAADGRLTLTAMAGGQESTLAEAAEPQSATVLRRLGLVVGHARVAVTLDGRTVLEVPQTGLCRGAVGLLVEGPGEACFDNVQVTFHEPRTPRFDVTAQFAREDTMSNWVDPSRQWRRAEDGTCWYDVPLFGEFALWLPEVDPMAGAGSVAFAVGPQPQLGAAPLLRLTTEAGSPTVVARITQGEQALAESRWDAEPGDRVRLCRQGRCLAVWLGHHLLTSWRDEAFAGRHLGLRVEGLPINLAAALVSSPNLVDVTFTGAPTGWTPGFGVWEITDRWPCAPGWSWFGGSRHASPLLWSKDVLEGDQVLEFWAGLLMDLPKEPGYSHASDLNAILCGDGTNLCSGYSFILAGDNNTRSTMLKGNTVVAENANVKFENPISTNFAFHRHWFDIRIEKTGNHLRYSVDDNVVAEWDDPDVLSGGRVGFWSYQGNGLLIARARMAAERVRR